MGDRWVVGNYTFKRCPFKEITNKGMEYLQAYRFYKAGKLPCAGGWLDQTYSFVEAMGLIDKEVARVEKQQMKGKY